MLQFFWRFEFSEQTQMLISQIETYKRWSEIPNCWWEWCKGKKNAILCTNMISTWFEKITVCIPGWEESRRGSTNGLPLVSWSWELTSKAPLPGRLGRWIFTIWSLHWRKASMKGVESATWVLSLITKGNSKPLCSSTPTPNQSVTG